MEKVERTPEEIYKGNQQKSKLLRRISPIIFWGCLALSILCLVLAIRHSFGNVAEIMELLDSKKFDGDQLRDNYQYLTNKYGEWVIGNGSMGFQITFVHVGHALFSGLMFAFLFLSVTMLVSAFVLGKWLLPKISEQILQDNQDMVNLTVLRDHDKLEKQN